MLAGLTAILLVSCGSARRDDTLHGRLVAEGSSSLYPFVQAAAEAFGKDHPEVAFDIKHGGSGAGIKQLAEKGDLSFANASRPVKDAELLSAEQHGRQLHATVVAAEAVTVVVSPDNPIGNVSKEDLKQIFFTGEKTDWSQIAGSGKTGPIHVVALDPKVSGTGEMFTEMIGGHAKPPYGKGAKVVPDNPDVPGAITADPDAIAFCSQAIVAGTKLHVLNVEGVAPSEQTVLDTSYPISRRLFVLTDGLPKGLTADFVLYLLSEPGQRIARARGFTPVTLEVSL
jgi:phosphate transport system substrate-binding protein